MNEIIKYLSEERKMKLITEGKYPHWMYNFGNKSKDYVGNDYFITIWF